MSKPAVLGLLKLAIVTGVLCAGLATGRCDDQQERGQRLNVLLLCIDDLRPELACYGVDYIHSPHIDRLAAQGVLFQRHYVQAPTCGASRYALLTGCYGPASNAALFQRADRIKQGESVSPSMPAWFRRHGYTSVSVGKVSHHPGGRGGPDWDQDQLLEMPHAWDRHLCPVGDWQHPRGFMHGLADGEIRVKAGDMDVLQSVAGADDIYPDGRTTNEALQQLDSLAAAGKPFFLAVGLLRPHLPFGAPARYMQHYRQNELPAIPHPNKPAGQTTWHASGEFMKYNRWNRNPNHDAEFADSVRRHYAACVSYADAMVGRILERLERLQLAERTIVVLWGDHGWHLGEHGIWGKHSLFEESLRSPLIVCGPGVPAGATTSEIVESIDVFPTLCELTGIPTETSIDGQTLSTAWKDESASGGRANSYFKRAKTTRSDTHRLIVHASGFVELYDHRSELGETLNVAEQYPDIVESLRSALEADLTRAR